MTTEIATVDVLTETATSTAGESAPRIAETTICIAVHAEMIVSAEDQATGALNVRDRLTGVPCVAEMETGIID